MAISGVLIITVINLIFWYLLFFKTHKYTREIANNDIWPRYTEWEISNDRYRFPMWFFLLWTIMLFLPVLALVLTIIFYTLFMIFFSTGFSDDFDTFKTERPKLFLQDFLTKKI